MISSKQALNETIRILKEHLSDVSGNTGSPHVYGFYQLAQNIFVKFRVADHGLYMQTFVSHNNGVAPELVSIISVVYRESPKEPIGTKWKTNGYPNSIIAYQYVYPCWDMDFDDISPIAFELITFAKTNTFIPPHLCTKDVKVQEIISDIGIRDVTNILRARYCSIEESNTHRYMKNRIKLNESTLKQIIAESMRKVLSEGINGWNPNYKNKDGIMYDDFATAFLRTISKTYHSSFQASQVVFNMVTQPAQICGCDYGRLMEQIKRDYENTEFFH